MKKNKYIVFATIGFELISLIILSLWAGKKLEEMGYAGAQALAVVIGFFIWFGSLIYKLKKLKND